MFILPCASHAQTVELTASADRTEVQIADPFQFKIELTGPSDTKVNFPIIGDKLGSFDVLEVQDRFDLPVATDSNVRVWVRTLTLETLETGKLSVPKIEISVQEKTGNAKLLRTDPTDISVASVVESSADLTKFADIADLVDVDQPTPLSRNIVWISLAAGFALALAAGCLFVAKRSRTSESAADWAVAQLSDQQNDFSRVEGIVRSFLEERFAFPARSLSSAAIADRLSSLSVDRSLVSGVEEMFAVSEQVKFGGVQISRGEESRLLSNARSLIVELDKHAIDLLARPQEVA